MCGGPPAQQWFDGARENADLAMERAGRVFKKARLFYERSNETKRFQLERAEKTVERAELAYTNVYVHHGKKDYNDRVERTINNLDRALSAVDRAKLACRSPEQVFGKATHAFMKAKRAHETAIELFEQRQGDFFLRDYC